MTRSLRRRCPSLPMRRCAWPLLRLSARAGLVLRHGAAVRLRPAAASSSSSSSSSGGGGLRAPDTSLFVPVPLKPAEGAAEEDVGAELTRPLDKGEGGGGAPEPSPGCGNGPSDGGMEAGRRGGRAAGAGLN